MVEVPGSVGTSASLSLRLGQTLLAFGALLFMTIGVVSVLALASASSAASVVDLLRSDESVCPPTICNRYQFAATLAFLTWFLSLSSSLFNLWLLPSL
ncbi:unnamed protein product [Brassica oleracea]|uniref:(rape) hypothetical protein n=1 Tax=Brassica napus TaxID=3708 RepID=A0A816U812_BRANA|nr:unnamed protein product [Brassica napus]